MPRFARGAPPRAPLSNAKTRGIQNAERFRILLTGLLTNLRGAVLTLLRQKRSRFAPSKSTST